MTTTLNTKIDTGYNNINVWLNDKLRARGLNISSFAKALNFGRTRESGLPTISTATIWRWCNDTYRPLPQTMQIVCEALSRLPIKLEDGSEYLEEVPWSEGLDQYTPKLRAWAAYYVNNPS